MLKIFAALFVFLTGGAFLRTQKTGESLPEAVKNTAIDTATAVQNVPLILAQPGPAKVRINAKFVYDTAKSLQPQFKNPIDPVMIATMAKIESSFISTARREEPQLEKQAWVRAKSLLRPGDSSLGLMQVLTAVAVDLYEKGYTYRGKPTVTTLQDPTTSIYFGMALNDWHIGRARRAGWIVTTDKLVEWYNGGFNQSNSMTRSHLAKFKAAYPIVKSEVQ